MPEQYGSRSRREFAGWPGRDVREQVLAAAGDVPVAAIHLFGVFVEIRVCGEMAARPVDKRTATGFDVVEIRGESEHERGPAIGRRIPVDVAGGGHRPGYVVFRPSYDRCAAPTMIVRPSPKMTTAELPDNRQKSAMVVGFGSRWRETEASECLLVVRPGLRIVTSYPEGCPDLSTPVIQRRGVNEVFDDQVAMRLEVGYLIGGKR